MESETNGTRNVGPANINAADKSGAITLTQGKGIPKTIRNRERALRLEKKKAASMVEKDPRVVIHEELMETIFASMSKKDSKSCKIDTWGNNHVIATKKELTTAGLLGLKFGDLVMLNNEAYSNTLAVYIGLFSEPITPNNKEKEHWFLAQDEVAPHYYGDLSENNYLDYGIKLVISAQDHWIEQILSKILR